MATIKILLRKNKKKDGLIPVYLRITKDRKAKFISTGIRVSESDWDEVNFKVKKSRTNYKQMNATLSQKVAEAENLSLNLESKSPTVTSRIIKEKLKGSKSSNFFDFCELILKEYISKEMIGTHDKAHAIINKLKDFNGSGHLIFNDLTPNYLERYDAHCRKKWENKTNTVLKDMKFIRKVVNDAIRQDLMEMHNNPFLKYKMRSEKTNRTFLTEDELQAIAKVNLTPGTRMELHRDMFIFSAYAGGLRVSDMLLLKWKNVDKTHVNFIIRKTQEQISIKIPDVALNLLDKYRGKRQVPENYVFPMLKNGLDEDVEIPVKQTPTFYSKQTPHFHLLF